MYRFLLGPRWIVSHVLIAALVVTMINLGFWQIRRLDERRDLNAKISGRALAPPTDFSELAVDIDSVGDGDAVDFRSTIVSGTYLPEDEVIVPGRKDGGLPGLWVLTPLQVLSGEVVLVLRGSVALAAGDDTAPIEVVAPPSGPVVVQGWIRRSEARPALQPADAHIDTQRFSRIDVPRIGEVLQRDLEPVLIQAGAQKPETASDLLNPIPLPELTEGSHLSYSVQWFIFSAIAVVGYPLVLRRLARNRARSVDATDATDATDDTDAGSGRVLADASGRSSETAAIGDTHEAVATSGDR